MLTVTNLLLILGLSLASGAVAFKHAIPFKIESTMLGVISVIVSVLSYCAALMILNAVLVSGGAMLIQVATFALVMFACYVMASLMSTGGTGVSRGAELVYVRAR